MINEIFYILSAFLNILEIQWVFMLNLINILIWTCHNSRVQEPHVASVSCIGNVWKVLLTKRVKIASRLYSAQWVSGPQPQILWVAMLSLFHHLSFSAAWLRVSLCSPVCPWSLAQCQVLAGEVVWNQSPGRPSWLGHTTACLWA